MIFERGHFKSSTIQKSFINESLKEVRTFSSKTASTEKTTVFLSHKHQDLEDVEEAKGIIELLEKHNVKVYIDSMDNKLPKQTSGDTATRLKQVIKFCDKFILLASEKAIKSVWCNWELGIGDVHKYADHIALVPIKEKGTEDDKYAGNEYLQIYPSLVYRNGKTYYHNTRERIKAGYYIRKPKKNKSGAYTIILLEKWLNQ